MDNALCLKVNKKYSETCMITLSLFPCSFTDGARIIGELSNALDKPVYTDEMVLNEVVETTGRSLKNSNQAYILKELSMTGHTGIKTGLSNR